LSYPTWLPHLFYFVGKFFSCIGFNLVYILTAELFPTRTRTTRGRFYEAVPAVIDK
jgi:hypothetical protein